jgi:hypothetical protein
MKQIGSLVLAAAAVVGAGLYLSGWAGGVAGACDGKEAAAGMPACCAKGAAATTASADKGCGMKAEGAAAKAGGCPHAGMAKDAVLTSTTGEGEAPAMAEGGHACPHMAQMKAEAAKGCMLTPAQLATASEVTVTGKVMCAHCDLHQTETCKSVFQSSTAANTVYTVCTDGLGEALTKVTKHGEVEAQVHGRVVTAGDEKILEVDGFKLGTM